MNKENPAEFTAPVLASAIDELCKAYKLVQKDFDPANLKQAKNIARRIVDMNEQDVRESDKEELQNVAKLIFDAIQRKAKKDSKFQALQTDIPLELAIIQRAEEIALMPGKGAGPNDPTPREIAERTATLRRSWSEATHLEKAGIKEKPYTAPHVRTPSERDMGR